jgi:pectate lyase
LSGINPRAGGKAKVENNYFKNSKDVLGTFYTDLLGSWQVSGNIFDNVTWSTPGTENHPAGPNPVSNTTISIPYSYTLDAASCVPAIVTQTAGANKGMQVSNGTCTPPTSTPTQTGSPTASPTTSPTASPTTSPTSGPSQPTGTNLSIGAGADGSSKGGGTSYGNVIDGNLSTYWSPSSSTGSISVKWSSAKTVSTIVIREASGSAGSIGSWQVLNADTGAVLKSGTGAGVIAFTSTSLKKITFKINSSTATPKVAEFQTYAA